MALSSLYFWPVYQKMASSSASIDLSLALSGRFLAN